MEDAKVPDVANQQVKRRTGWAILVAIISTFFFYAIYYLLFGLVVSAFARYDSSFGSGLGAFLLLVFGSSILGAISGSTVAKSIFPNADRGALFYSLSTFFLVVLAVTVASELVRAESSMIVVVIQCLVMFSTILALRVVLAPLN